MSPIIGVTFKCYFILDNSNFYLILSDPVINKSLTVH
jgi:hypothetical protein